MKTDPEPPLTAGRVAAMLGVSRKGLWLLDHVLKPRRVEPFRWRLYDREVVERVAAERRTAREARRRGV